MTEHPTIQESTMTIVDQNRREQPQRPQPEQHANQAHAAEQRGSAAAVHTAVAVARAEQQRAAHLGADERRWATGFRVLDEQINGRDEAERASGRADMSVLRPGNVLRHCPGAPEAGTANIAAVREFVARILKGELPHDVLESMHAARMERALSGAVRHADAMYQRAHGLERAATSPPALPPGAVVPSSNGVPLPRRESIAPEVPPMYPPAPPESTAEQTGAIIMALRADGHEIPVELERAARKDGRTGLNLGPSPDPLFAAAALPQARVARAGDTAQLPVVPDVDDVLADLGMDDASAGVVDGPKGAGASRPPVSRDADSAGDADD